MKGNATLNNNTSNSSIMKVYNSSFQNYTTKITNMELTIYWDKVTK
jgi:hypothetical protein